MHICMYKHSSYSNSNSNNDNNNDDNCAHAVSGACFECLASPREASWCARLCQTFSKA